MTMKGIRTCIIGSGYGKRVLLPVCELNPGIQVVAFVVKSRIPPGIPEHIRVFIDLEEALRQTCPDLVLVASPPFAHQEHVATALRYGKHVLCEKPLALEAPLTHPLEALRRDLGLVGTVDFSFRYIPARAYLAELVRSGSIGTLQSSYLSFFRNDFRSWPSSWYYDRSLGGGMLQATGGHLIDSAITIHNSRFLAVCCRLVEREGIDVGLTLLLEAEDGSVCTIAVSHSASGQGKHLVEVHGTNGSLFLNGNGDLARMESGILTMCPVPEQYYYGLLDTQWKANPRLQPTARIISATMAAITEGRTADDIGFPDAIRNQRIIDGARESHNTGRRIKIDA